MLMVYRPNLASISGEEQVEDPPPVLVLIHVGFLLLL